MCAAPRGGCHQPHTSAAAGDGDEEWGEREQEQEKVMGRRKNIAFVLG